MGSHLIGNTLLLGGLRVGGLKGSSNSTEIQTQTRSGIRVAPDSHGGTSCEIEGFLALLNSSTEQGSRRGRRVLVE
jgi:hypothetical protein